MIDAVVKKVKNALRFSGRQERARRVVLDDTGGEILSSVPMQPPLGFHREPSMFDVMRGMIDQHQRDLAEAGYESPDEADDFDVDDDFDPTSPYEHNFDPPADPQPAPEVPPEPQPAPPAPPADGPGTPLAPAPKQGA